MSGATTAQPVSISLAAVVIRCGCGEPESHAGAVCPTPRETEDLGIVNYWHMYWHRRLAYALSARISRRPHGSIQRG